MLRDGDPVGHVTSFGYSPSLGKWIGLAYVAPDQAGPGTPITLRGFAGAEVQALVAALPFYDAANARQEM